MGSIILIVGLCISAVCIAIGIGYYLMKKTELPIATDSEEANSSNAGVNEGVFNALTCEVVSEEVDKARKMYALVDSVIEEQLNCYYTPTTALLGTKDCKVMDYDSLKDSLSLSEYRNALLVQARKIGMTFSNEVLIANAIRSLESDYSITKYIKKPCRKLPVDYRTVKGHKYVTLQYALQYERGLKMAQEIEWAIKAKEEVERFLVERNKQ